MPRPIVMSADIELRIVGIGMPLARNTSDSNPVIANNIPSRNTTSGFNVFISRTSPFEFFVKNYVEFNC
ncbi:MAG: hypothetical protein WC678_00400 [Parcubacteria group bacterium]|jgi:hypothetical protein